MILLLLFLFAQCCNHGNSAPVNGDSASCFLKSHDQGTVIGMVTITDLPGDSEIWMSMQLKSEIITPGKHGFHIHQNPIEGVDCNSAGGHFNPTGQTHGGITGKFGDFSDRHVGDLDNVIAGDGNVWVRYEWFFGKRWEAPFSIYGENSIIGHSLVLHVGEDDMGIGNHADSSTTGHAGARLACCTIA